MLTVNRVYIIISVYQLVLLILNDMFALNQLLHVRCLCDADIVQTD